MIPVKEINKRMRRRKQSLKLNLLVIGRILLEIILRTVSFISLFSQRSPGGDKNILERRRPQSIFTIFIVRYQ